MAELEQGIQKTSAMIESQSFRLDDNSQHLLKAKQATSRINEELKETLSSTSDLSKSLRTGFFASPIWTVSWCSLMSLVLGSYGLPPSLIRNGGLVAFGKSNALLLHQ